MKNLMLSFLIVSIGFSAIAQNSKTSIYFNSGEHELSEASVKELADFLSSLDQYPDFDLDLYAYTDDVGTANYNKELAKNRIQSIQDFLEKNKITPNNTAIKGINQLALENQENIEVQRANNRRVDLVVIPFQPESLNDLYSYTTNKDTETFTIRADRDTTIRGKKGGILFIPAGTFQTTNGTAINSEDVEISLYEAYDYDDILLSNLTTMSDDKLLETGGMVHIDAKTMSGEQLEIVPKKEISLTMPSKEELPKDMQLFYGDRDPHEISENINWEATNKPFRSTNFDENPPEFGFSSIEMDYIKNISQLDHLPAWPKHDRVGVKPVAPKEPRINNPIAPTWESVLAENPKKKTESKTRYEERIEKLLKSAERSYQRRLVSNESAKKSYKIQLASYQENLEKYHKAVASKKQYQQELLELRDYIYENREMIYTWSQTFDWAGPQFMTKVANAFNASQGLQDYKNYLMIECQRFGMNDLANKIKTSNFNAEVKFFENMARKFMRCARTNQVMAKNHRVPGRMKYLKRRLGKESCYFASILRADNSPGHSVEEVYNAITGLSSQSLAFNDLIDNYNEVLDKSGFYENAQKLDTLGKILREIHEKIMDEKVARGLISKKEAKILDGKAAENYYMNTIGINRLGWINCDRFMQMEGYDHVVAINNAKAIKNNSNTKVDFFVILDNSRSIIGLSPVNGVDGRLVSPPLPAHAKVTVIGFRVNGRKTQACKYAGNVTDLKSLDVEFKDYNIKELKTLLSHI